MEYLLLLGVAVLIAVVVGTLMYLIMTYGTKEKTYEEAILEQRQRSEDALLFGKSGKDKQKDKKKTKGGKKVKEKTQKPTNVRETSDSISSEETDQGSQHLQKTQHVGFLQPEAAIIDEPAPVMEESKKKKKKEAKKSILVHRDDPQGKVEVIPPVDVNNFDKIHPKDDLELRRLSRDEGTERSNKKTSQKQNDSEKSHILSKKDKESGVTKVVQNPKNENNEKQTSIKPDKQTSVKSEKSLPAGPSKEQQSKEAIKQQEKEKTEKPASVKAEKPSTAKAEKPAEEVVIAVSSIPTQATSSKSLKNKKKNEITLEQMSMGRDAITCSVIESALMNSELSRTEIQNLIDLLLNKQQGSEAEHAEWIEGRQDPVVKLKKAFAEKEKALQAEQEATLAVQNKLKEVRAEANSERSRLTQAVRQLEEKLAARNAELAASTAKTQHEKQVLTQQIQQLKHQIEQEHMVLRKMQEEQAQAQAAVQARQQLEMHVAALGAQHQEQRQQMAEQMEMLSAQVAQLQEQLKNAQNASQGEVHAKLKQLSEMKSAKEDVERQLSTALQRENLANSEVSKVKELASQRQIELEKAAAEASHLKEEIDRLTAQVSVVSQLQSENRQLREEIESLAAQVTAVTERPAAEGRENGDVSEEKHINAKLISAQLIHEEALREKDIQVEKLVEQVKQAEKSASSTIENLKSEISSHKNKVMQLTDELDQQKKKNDELRNKNYKAMDCIAASEKLVQSKMQESEKLAQETQKSVQVEEETKTRECLQRLFPSISIDEKVHSEWIKKFSTAVSDYVSELNSKASLSQPSVISEDQSVLLADLEKRNTQLSNMVTNYKTIIEDTEGMLNKLQLHVEAEETKWRQQLATIEADLESVKRERDNLLSRSQSEPNNQLQGQLQGLQDKLTSAEAEKARLESELSSYNRALASIDQLKEERDHLAADLEAEKSRGVDLSKDLLKLKEQLEVSHDALSKERSNYQLLREEIEKLKDTSTAASIGSAASISQTLNGATNGPVSSDVVVTELSNVVSSSVPTFELLNRQSAPFKTSKKKKKKAASTKKKNISGWLKKKVVGGSKSPNLSARSDDFLTAERTDSTS